MFDGKAFGAEIVGIVRGYVDSATAPLIAECKALKANVAELNAEVVMLQKRPDLAEIDRLIGEAIAAIPATEPGKDADPEAIKALIDEAVAALPVPKDGESVAPEAVRAMVDEAVAALPAPNPGKDADPETIRTMVAEAVAELPRPEDGKSFTAEDAAPLIAEGVARAVAALPAPEAGKDADPEAVREIVRAEVESVAAKPEDVERLVSERVQEAVAALPSAKDGEDGKSVDSEQVAALFAEAISAIPMPQDGKSVTVDDVAPLIAEAVEKAVAALPSPKDGVGVAGALIDRAGALVLTLTDGTTKELGQVVGRDVDPLEVERLISAEVAKIPAPQDGKDGFSLDSFDTELKEDGRTLLLKFAQGDVTETHELCFPIVIDRGVYKAEAEYAKGDGVTWGGSFWIAQRDTSDKPETSDAWRLSVKKGRDGKSPTQQDLAPAIEASVAEAVKRLPKAKVGG